MVIRWVLNTKEIVEDGPDVEFAAARFPLADVGDDDPRRFAFVFGRLHGEGQPVTTPQMNTTDFRFEWTGQPIGAHVMSAWIALKLLVDLAVSRPLALECFDERAHSTRRDDFVGGHAAEVWPTERT